MFYVLHFMRNKLYITALHVSALWYDILTWFVFFNFNDLAILLHVKIGFIYQERTARCFRLR